MKRDVFLNTYASFPQYMKIGVTFCLDLNINTFCTDHLLIKDYLPTKFEFLGLSVPKLSIAQGVGDRSTYASSTKGSIKKKPSENYIRDQNRNIQQKLNMNSQKTDCWRQLYLNSNCQLVFVKIRLKVYVYVLLHGRGFNNSSPDSYV